ncbi:hypothetical protein PYW07_017439 [Mythimna separata]|uniref:RNA-directed DNA polymerase n=2 Tax=Mythimna separata TaxID=271217 RepID=A0AAD8DYE5_MYTSE|nr:hypothetical protein PYW07_017439 [Mythimna separata]
MPIINESIKFKIKGIDSTTDSPLSTLGQIPVTISTHSETHSDCKYLTHTFNLIDGLTIPYDGIVGNDLFNSMNGQINYEESMLYLKDIKFQMYFNEPVYTIPARTEVIIECTVENPEIGEGLIIDQHISRNLLIANCMVKVKNNNRINISILNTLEAPVMINSDLQLRLEPFQLQASIFIGTSDECHTFERTEEVLKELRVSHLNSEETEALYSVCSQFSDVFHLPDDQLTSTDAIEHKIKTTSDDPIHVKTYRFPECHKKEVDSQIEKMLRQGIIKPSMSPWSSPIWVVPKKLDASGQRKWRVVIDYRKLNDITIGDSYPIPNIAEILDQLGKSKYFSTLDLASGFHQINMSAEDSPKTAFSVPKGHYEFTRMPFGLKNAPSTFQRLMNSALSGLQGIQCFVYLDDIVIYSYDLASHIDNLTNVFGRLRQFKLKLQPDKCEFLRKEVSYLGHVITDKGVKPNAAKVSAILDFPVPKTPKDVKSFLGFVSYYRRFIPDLSSIAKPLTNLLKKNVEFVWSNEHQLAFEILKNKLITAPLLIYPDFSKPFILTCDASNYAISSILSQGEVGKDKPIAYASRTLNKSESNYSTTEKELLAILFGCKTFRPYLYGRKFLIVTDHRPLRWLFNHSDPSSKLQRWRLKLEEYEYEIIYRKGKLNNAADALSRYPPVKPINAIDPVPSTSGQNLNPPGSNRTIDSDDLVQLEDLIDPLVPPRSLPELGNLDDLDNVTNRNTPSPIDHSDPTTPSDNSSHSTLDGNYSDFLKTISKDFNSNVTIIEHNESLCKTDKKYIIIPTSIDMDESVPYVQEIISNIPNLSEFSLLERTLHTYLKYELENKIYYFLFTKVNHFDTCTYDDIYKSLKSLRNELVVDLTGQNNPEIAISDFSNPFDSHQYLKVYNIILYLFHNSEINVHIYKNAIIYPSLSEIPKIMKENHDLPIAGHLGSTRMLKRIQEKYYWKNMRSDVENYVKKCPQCQTNKALRKVNRAPMQITSLSTRPFERVALDIVGPLPEAGNDRFRYILTLQDDLTKFSTAYPITNTTAEESCECLVHFITLFGIPKMILTDQGTNFTAELFKQTCKLLKIKQLWSTPYHPQTQGALERSHSTLKEYLKSYINEEQNNWHRFVYTAMLAYNSAIHSTTHFSPYELVFGTKPYVPDSVYEETAGVTYPDYVRVLQNRLKYCRTKAIEHIQKSKVNSKAYYDTRTRPIKYKVGDLVYLKNHLRLRKALSPIWKGPYKIIKIHGNNTASLLINRRHVKHHFDEMKLHTSA